ncbi:MAG: DNA polymerase III subunit chi [Burkholderiaceae bacterium]|nr:DNA polymerase III subunit chi [Burkholderiaceae bacterium]
MTRIDFHFNTPEKLVYACRLVRKVMRSGSKTVVFCSEHEPLERLDRLLWTFSDRDFLPHVQVHDPLAPETPIVLATGAVDTPHHDVLVNIGAQTPPIFSRFERVVELVSTEEADRAAARERWRFYRDRGYPMNRHDCAERH